MKISYNVLVTLEEEKFNINRLILLVIETFNKAINTWKWNTIYIWKDRYISIDFNDKKSCSCYIELWNTYIRKIYDIDTLLKIIKQDPYIKRNFIFNKN